MKVFTKVVFQISNGEVLDSESYEYDGPVAQCGGSGGGGGSGQVDYPNYMESQHGTWLGDADTLMDAARTANPWTGEVSYDPDEQLAIAWCAVCAFNTVVDGLDHRVDWHAIMTQAQDVLGQVADETSWESSVAQAQDTIGYIADETEWEASMSQAKTTIDEIIDDTYISEASSAHNDILNDQLESVDLPKFKAGMADINAVMSSAFVVGQSIMHAYKERNVSKYAGDLGMRLHEQRNNLIGAGAVERLKFPLMKNQMVLKGTEDRLRLALQRNQMIANSSAEMVRFLLQEVDFKKAVSHMSVEEKRIHIVAKTEEVDEQQAIDENNALWNLSTLQYGANMMASIGGAAGMTGGNKKPSKAQSALGGAMAGAAAGSAGGPGWGTAIGAVVGGVAGYLAAD